MEFEINYNYNYELHCYRSVVKAIKGLTAVFGFYREKSTLLDVLLRIVDLYCGEKVEVNADNLEALRRLIRKIKSKLSLFKRLERNNSDDWSDPTSIHYQAFFTHLEALLADLTEELSRSPPDNNDGTSDRNRTHKIICETSSSIKIISRQSDNSADDGIDSPDAADWADNDEDSNRSGSSVNSDDSSLNNHANADSDANVSDEDDAANEVTESNQSDSGTPDTDTGETHEQFVEVEEADQPSDIDLANFDPCHFSPARPSIINVESNKRSTISSDSEEAGSSSHPPKKFRSDPETNTLTPRAGSNAATPSESQYILVPDSTAHQMGIELLPVDDWRAVVKARDAVLLLAANIRKESQLYFMVVNVNKKKKFDPQYLSKASTLAMEMLLKHGATLKDICIVNPFGLLPGFGFPLMPKVTQLRIGRLESDLEPMAQENAYTFLGSKYFPPDFNFSTTFPNLTTISFDIPGLNKFSAWKDYFKFDPELEPVHSVKTIIFAPSMCLPNGWIWKFGQLFPKVEHLGLQTTQFSFLQNAGAIWNLKKLQNLTIRIDATDEDNFFPALDQAFTGFPLRTILALRDVSDSVDVSTFSGLRERPAIYKLKYLKSLQIMFVDDSNEVKAEYPPFLTWVTRLFAFQMCQQFAVKFSIFCANEANRRALNDAVDKSLEKYCLGDQ